jgi:hypothetical protein
MEELKQKVKEIFAKDEGGNSYVISQMHYYLNEKKYAKAKKIMLEELYLSEEDAKVLITYYKKKLSAKAKFVEISANEVVCEDVDNPIDTEMYLFVYGQGIYQSSAYESSTTKNRMFFGDKTSHDISKARQIFRIEWDF